MKRSVTTVAIAICALSLLGVASPADAATKKTETVGFSFSINDNNGSNVFGSVFSTDRCTQGRKVVLHAVSISGQRTVMGSDRASKNGAFNVLVGEDPPDLDHYEVFVPAERISRKLKCGVGFGSVYEQV